LDSTGSVTDSYEGDNEASGSVSSENFVTAKQLLTLKKGLAT